MKKRLELVKKASLQLAALSDQNINELLVLLAHKAEDQVEYLLEENALDLERLEPTDPLYDRLQLTPARIKTICDNIRHIATLPSPIGHVLKHTIRPNGLDLKQISVPFGVIGVIYEARPNVSFDVFALCFKSGNACVLKGSRNAEASNRAIVNLIHEALTEMALDLNLVALLPPTQEATTELLHANGYIDVVIPRGGKNLISYVRDNATVPIIETGAGICHTYIDESAALDKATRIVLNAKTRRVSVCNSLDVLLIHKQQLHNLAHICQPLQQKNVTLYADADSYNALVRHYPMPLLHAALPKDFETEFLDYKMAIKTVGSLEGAMEHIRIHGLGHSECIVAEEEAHISRFLQQVDAACVYANASTGFSDGTEFGLGAEIGISTQKLHARGPMALEELTTYKWVIRGNGHIREY